MPDHLFVHYHNLAPGQGEAYQDWLEHFSLPSLRPEGVTAMSWHQLSSVQITPDTPQPYRHVGLYECSGDAPELARCLGARVRKAAKRAGFLTTDRSHLFEYTTGVIHSAEVPAEDSPEYIMLVMGNFVPGLEPDYAVYYDEVHGPEVLASPGFSSLRRGRLVEHQSDCCDDQPANAIVVESIRTFDLHGVFDEFLARYYGNSPMGVTWQPRSPAAALNRTTHIFEPVRAFA